MDHRVKPGGDEVYEGRSDPRGAGTGKSFSRFAASSAAITMF
jgi:hypothetical protein